MFPYVFPLGSNLENFSPFSLFLPPFTFYFLLFSFWLRRYSRRVVVPTCRFIFGERVTKLPQTATL